jgi:manganese/zinc/iron transport system substrate-binding protein
MVADLVREVAGDRAMVTQLMGEGVDPHTYKASPGDVLAVNAADIVFYSGLHLEGKMAEMLARQARRKPAFAVCEHLPPEVVLMEGDAPDPHVWFDVSLWSRVAGIVAEALTAFDPPGAEEYRRRGKELQARLERLDEEVAREVASITPRERRVLVTAHDAFRYFGKRYDIEVVGIQGISTDSEAGVRRINELVDFLEKRRVGAVFVESSVSERNVRALIEGCAARKHRVVVGGELYSDSMGKAGTPEGTYEGMVRHNVRALVKALK